MSSAVTVAEVVAGNAYLLEEILLRLPGKCLTRFKLVSKQWCSLISSPLFVQSHSCRKPNRSPTGTFFSVDRQGYKDVGFVSFDDSNSPFQTIPSLSFLEYDNIVKKGAAEILQSCNGLLLCAVSTHRSEYSTYYHYCVCNPTTKQYRFIHELYGYSLGALILAYDPSISPHYKVVVSRSLSSTDGAYKYGIYSSEDQSWKQLTSPFAPVGDAIVLDDAIYWVNLCRESAVCFDMKTEKITQLSLPPKPKLKNDSTCFYKCLAGCGSNLHYSGDSGGAGKNFYVFEMSRDFSKWVAEYDLSVCPLVDAFPEVAHFTEPDYEETFYGFSALCVAQGVKGGRKLVLAIPGKLISYDLLDNSVKKLSDLDGELDHPFGYQSIRAFPFIESLSSV